VSAEQSNGFEKKRKFTAADLRVEANMVAFVHQMQQRGIRIATRLLRNPTEAEDVVQDGFLGLVEHLDTITGDPEKYYIQSIVNRARGVLRHRGVEERNGFVPGGDIVEFESTSYFTGDVYHDQDQQRVMELRDAIQAIKELPLHLRGVVLLTFLGYQKTEQAALLKIPTGTAKSRIHDARIELNKDPRITQLRER